MQAWLAQMTWTAPIFRSAPPKLKPTTVGSRSVLGLIDQAVRFDPGHHAAQLFTDLFDRMLGLTTAGGLEARLACLVFEDEIAHQTARLDVFQDPLHFLLLLLGHDARARLIIAIFSGNRDRVGQIGHANFLE